MNVLHRCAAYFRKWFGNARMHISPLVTDNGAQPASVHHGWRLGLASMAMVGVLAMLTYASAFYPSGFLVVASLGLLLAGGGLLIGGLFGFLFGIPRSLQRPSVKGDGSGGASDKPEGPQSPAYRPNTNLEEISDWLTKILVGVGLTQISRLYP